MLRLIAREVVIYIVWAINIEVIPRASDLNVSLQLLQETDKGNSITGVRTEVLTTDKKKSSLAESA